MKSILPREHAYWVQLVLPVGVAMACSRPNLVVHLLEERRKILGFRDRHLFAKLEQSFVVGALGVCRGGLDLCRRPDRGLHRLEQAKLFLDDVRTDLVVFETQNERRLNGRRRAHDNLPF